MTKMFQEELRLAQPHEEELLRGYRLICKALGLKPGILDTQILLDQALSCARRNRFPDYMQGAFYNLGLTALTAVDSPESVRVCDAQPLSGLTVLEESDGAGDHQEPSSIEPVYSTQIAA